MESVSVIKKNQIFSRNDIDKMEKGFKVNFINSLSGFKSANLIGTQSEEGINNLCIVSSVFHLGSSPPLFGMIIRPHTVTRDTIENIQATGQYTINHVNTHIITAAHQTSARYDKHVNEFDETNLSETFTQNCKAPYVEEANIKMGLQLCEIKHLDINTTELVIGEVIEVVTDQDLNLEDGYLDIEKAETACVSGLDSYHQTQRIDRFSYAKPGKDIKSIW